MKPQSPPSQREVRPPTRPFDDRLLGGIGRIFSIATYVGFGLFGAYIVLRASGATAKNFGQWQALLAGRPMPTVSDWISNVGIGLHFLMGAVLVLACPILLSARIRSRQTASCGSTTIAAASPMINTPAIAALTSWLTWVPRSGNSSSARTSR